MNKNPLCGKKYKFRSTTNGTDVKGIESEVEIDYDRIFIKTGKEKDEFFEGLKNKFKIGKRQDNQIPAIFLEDITGISITKKIRGINWGWIILAIMSIYATGFIGVLILIAGIFLCIDRKITISQRNGKDIVIYSYNKENAYNFRDDMRTILNIR